MTDVASFFGMARQIYKNISTLFLFPLTIDLLFFIFIVVSCIKMTIYVSTVYVYVYVYGGRVHGCQHDRVPGPYTALYTVVYMAVETARPF